MSVIPHSRGATLWRFLLAAVIVIAFTAATTAVAGLLQFKQIAEAFSFNPAIKTKQVVIANPGEAQTLLLVGSDHRAGESYRMANTDTMLLVRIDPNSTTINVMSLPRDLKVEVPGHGTFKLNAAYSLGGTDLLLKTIKQNVFPGLDVNHIIDINFRGFSDLIDAIGCVYADVDHRYFNNTATDRSPYSSIDIQPGYQKLCGDDQSASGALAFVRFRHLDTDIVRNARQQDFLRWAKQGYSQSDLVNNRNKLVAIFGHSTQTDANLHSADGVENLFTLVAFSAGHAVKSIPFPAILQNCGAGQPGPRGQVLQTPCYVLADPRAEAAVFRKFMAVTLPRAPRPAPAPGAPAPGAPARPPHHPRSGLPPGLMADAADGRAQAAALGNAGMPAFFPAQIVAGSQYCTPGNPRCPVEEGQVPAQLGIRSGYPRAYQIHDQSGAPHAAYVMTLVINPVLGQYYDVQGMTWQNPPILRSPSKIETVAGKRLLLYYDGGKLNVVAWHTSRGVYWISNTLTGNIGAAQMVAIAASLTPAA